MTDEEKEVFDYERYQSRPAHTKEDLQIDLDFINLDYDFLLERLGVDYDHYRPSDSQLVRWRQAYGLDNTLQGLKAGVKGYLKKYGELPRTHENAGNFNGYICSTIQNTKNSSQLKRMANHQRKL